jgi:hypothetical protein
MTAAGRLQCVVLCTCFVVYDDLFCGKYCGTTRPGMQWVRSSGHPQDGRQSRVQWRGCCWPRRAHGADWMWSGALLRHAVQHCAYLLSTAGNVRPAATEGTASLGRRIRCPGHLSSSSAFEFGECTWAVPQ